MRYKTCNRCGKEKPATTEYFGKDKKCKDGFRGQCKDCISKYMKQWYKENKEHYREYSKQYRKENKEKIKEYNKQWYKENKEYFKHYRKQHYQENKEHYREYIKQWRQENKEHYREYIKQYRKENKEKIKEYRKENKDRYRQHSQTYRTRKRLLPATLTVDQWEKIKDDFNNECAYCGMTEEEHRKRFNEQLHQEHFIPTSKGGEYTHNNIIPGCRSCNTSKQDTDFFEWYPTHEHYSIRREQKILDYLGYTEQKAQQLTLI